MLFMIGKCPAARTLVVEYECRVNEGDIFMHTFEEGAFPPPHPPRLGTGPGYHQAREEDLQDKP